MSSNSDLSPDQRFWIVWDTALAIEALESRGILPTLQAIRTELLDGIEDPTVTPARIRFGMAGALPWLSSLSPYFTAEEQRRRLLTLATLREQLQTGPEPSAGRVIPFRPRRRLPPETAPDAGK